MARTHASLPPTEYIEGNPVGGSFVLSCLDSPQHHSVVNEQVFICCEGFNACVTTINRQDFKFPILLILCGTLSTFVAGLLYLLARGGLEFQKLEQCWKLLLLLALLTTAG